MKFKALVVFLSILTFAAQGSFLQGRMLLISTPNSQGHPEYFKTIMNAKQSVLMTMFHLTDVQIVAALIDAKKRGLEVRVILDGEGLKDQRRRSYAAQLLKGGVEVRASSPGFSITHEKAMIIDHSLAFITAINLTDHAATTRDLGIVFEDPSAIKEMLSVFEADWLNAQNKTRVTPPLSDPNLVWSPVNSGSKLKALIASAQRTVLSTVENLGDPDILNAFAQDAMKGIDVRLIVPMCDKNPDPTFNYKFFAPLQKSGVKVKVMPAPETAEHPYMHSKMILVDGNTAYVGSVNFSINSVHRARELGIIFGMQPIAAQIAHIFEGDWARAIVPGDPPKNCPRE